MQTLFDTLETPASAKPTPRVEPLAKAGATFSPALDGARLETLLARVKAELAKGEWLTLGELKARCGGSEAGISARIRELRRPEHGGMTIDKRRRGDPRGGLWEYRAL